jgi:hypothetical protein
MNSEEMKKRTRAFALRIIRLAESLSSSIKTSRGFPRARSSLR